MTTILAFADLDKSTMQWGMVAMITLFVAVTALVSTLTWYHPTDLTFTGQEALIERGILPNGTEADDINRKGVAKRYLLAGVVTMFYAITYDISDSTMDHTPFFEKIKTFGAWMHYLEHTWVIKTESELTAPEIFSQLEALIDKEEDYILIVKIDTTNRLTLASGKGRGSGLGNIMASSLSAESWRMGRRRYNARDY